MFYFHAFSNGNIFTCIKTGKAEQKNIATSQTMTKAKSIALLALAFFATMGTSWLSKATAQTTTIFSEDFSDDSGSSTTTLTGDQWVATETTSIRVAQCPSQAVHSDFGQLIELELTHARG